MLARERLYLTADRKALVAEGDKRGAFLYAAPGDEIPQAAADQFGLVEGGLKGSPSPMAKAAAGKQAKAAADKEAKAAADKEAKDKADKEAKTAADKEAAVAANKGE